MATKIPLALGNQAWDMMATAQQIDQCCGLGRGVNLFDNGHLGTGVISQRGITSETVGTISAGWHYTLDRWLEFSYGEWELTPDGLKLSDVGNYLRYFSFGQVVDRLGPKSTFPRPYPLTYSVLIDNQVYSMTLVPTATEGFYMYLNEEKTIWLNYRFGYNSTYPLFELCIAPGFFSSPITIKALKLEIGTEQTLAHLEENNWVLNDSPPNPVLELLKCQKYFIKISGATNCPYYHGFVNGSGLPSLFIPTPVILAKKPTVSGEGPYTLSAIGSQSNSEGTASGTSLGVVFSNCGVVRLQWGQSLINLTARQPIVGTISGEVFLDANL